MRVVIGEDQALLRQGIGAPGRADACPSVATAGAAVLGLAAGTVTARLALRASPAAAIHGQE